MQSSHEKFKKQKKTCRLLLFLFLLLFVYGKKLIFLRSSHFVLNQHFSEKKLRILCEDTLSGLKRPEKLFEKKYNILNFVKNYCKY